MTIDDPSNGVGTDYSDTETVGVVDWNPNSTLVQFDLNGVFDIRPGQIITLTDGTTTKTHTVTNLAIGDINVSQDTVTGTSDSQGGISVSINTPNPQASLNVVPDQNGNWNVDFNGTYDIQPGTKIEAQQSDEDGDVTSVFQTVPTPPPAIGSPDHPIRIVFFPGGWAVEDGAQILVNALSQSTGLTFQIYAPSTNSAAVRMLCDSPEDTMGFLPGFGYVLGHDLCGVNVSFKALRNGWGFYWSEVLVPRNSTIQNVSDLNGLKWGFPSSSSASGYMAPMAMWNEAGITPGVHVATGNHPSAVTAVYNGDVDFATTYFAPPIKPEGEPAWQIGDDPDIPADLIDDCAVSGDGSQLLCGGWQVMDARATIRAEAPDVIQQIRILDISEPIANDTISFGPNFPAELRAQIENALVAFAETGDWNLSIGSPPVYGWQGITLATDADYAFTRQMLTAAGINLDNLDNPPAPYSSHVDFYKSWNGIVSGEWPVGTPVELTVDDPETPESPDFQHTLYPEPSSPGHPSLIYDIPQDQMGVQPGYVLTLNNGQNTIELTISSIQITDVDLDADTISGTAEPYAYVIVHVSNSEAERKVDADTNGNWTADFSVPEPGSSTGEMLYDIVPGTFISAYVPDQSDDKTISEWHVPNPNIRAFTNQDRVDGWQWIAGATANLTIDDPGTPQNPDFTAEGTVGFDQDKGWTYINIEFGGDYDLKPGDIVTLTDGATTKTVMATNVTVTNVDAATNVAAGTAQPESDVHVAACDKNICFERWTKADLDGNWSTDFDEEVPGQQAFDIVAGIGVAGEQFDDDGDSTIFQWDVSNPPYPNFSVRANNDQVEAWEWTMGDTLTLSIDNPNTADNPDYTTNKTVTGVADWDPRTYVSFDLSGIYDIQPGDTVSMSNGSLTKTTIVANLSFTNVDLDTNMVYGIAEPNQTVNIWTCYNGPCVNRDETADQDGNWSTNFAIPGEQDWEQGTMDLRPGSWVDSNVTDEDGDQTMYGWNVPNPMIVAYPNENYVEGWEWTVGRTVTIEIDDPDNGPGADFTDSKVVQVSEGDPKKSYVGFDMGGFVLHPGQLVTMTDGTTTKNLVVRDISITEVNLAADTVSGTSDPGSEIHVYAQAENGTERHALADTNGNWLVDFSIPGDGQNEQQIFDIAPGSWLDARKLDEDGDASIARWYVPNPNFQVRANEDRVEAWEWAEGETLTLEVDNPATTDNPDYRVTRTVEISPWDPNQTYADFNLWGVYDIQPGDTVRLSNGTITKTTVVTNLAFTAFDVDADTVRGIAAPGSRVDIWACRENDCFNRHVNADQNGNWLADFAHPGVEGDEQDIFDIVRGTWVDSQQNDEDNDRTLFGQNIPNPYIEASPNGHWVHGRGWPLGTQLTMTITGPGVNYTTTAVMGQAPWNPGDPNDIVADFAIPGDMNIEAGQVITVTDGSVEKTLTVSSLNITGVNLQTDSVSGTASANTQVQVCANLPDRCIQRFVTADNDGKWSANYHEAGVSPDDPDTFDIQPGSNGWAAEYDEDSDRTWADWWTNSYTLHVVPTYPEVHGHDWPYMDDVTLIIDDDTDPNNGVLYEQTKNAEDDPWCGYPCFDLKDVFTLEVGQYVTMTDGTVTKTVHLSRLRITEVNLGNNTLSGIADPGSTVQVNIWSQNGISRTVQADQDGNWSVDFSVPSSGENEVVTDIGPGDNGRAIQLNPDGTDDGTMEYWKTPLIPFIEANAADDEVVGSNWPDGASITLTIDNPLTPASPDYTAIKTSRSLAGFEDRVAVVAFRLFGVYDIQPGDILQLTDGSTTKTVLVTVLHVDEVNADTDIISGTAAPGSDVNLNICGPHQGDATICVDRHVIADGAGLWSMNLSVAGDEDSEKNTLDLSPGSDGTVTQSEEDGDTILARASVFTAPPPGFTPTESVTVPSGGSIQIASVVDLSENPDVLGAQLINAIQMAIDDFGLINGFSVAQTPFDGGCHFDFIPARDAALNVIDDPQMVGVIGHPCSYSYAAGLPIYEQAGIVSISGSSTKFDVPRFGPTVSNRLTLNDFY
ncbi:MAG: PhnD/SsuA/transferrin family substrate-binding protein, partial [Chloroflexi bacterium]|nr:PhnD/SsuA/transferrin family substrate-binding protein [Chloroflexota bacterium]